MKLSKITKVVGSVRIDLPRELGTIEVHYRAPSAAMLKAWALLPQDRDSEGWLIPAEVAVRMAADTVVEWDVVSDEGEVLKPSLELFTDMPSDVVVAIANGVLVELFPQAARGSDSAATSSTQAAS